MTCDEVLQHSATGDALSRTRRGSTAESLMRRDGYSQDYPLLPRELKNVSDAVRRAPGPPVPQLLRPSAIRVATDDDATRIAEWMNRPHLAEAWEYDWPVERWRKHLKAQVEGDRMALYQLDRDTARKWMV